MTYSVPPLPYDYGALDASIDEQTMLAPHCAYGRMQARPHPRQRTRRSFDGRLGVIEEVGMVLHMRAQCETRIGRCIACSSSRVVPPRTHSRRREWP